MYFFDWANPFISILVLLATAVVAFSLAKPMRKLVRGKTLYLIRIAQKREAQAREIAAANENIKLLARRLEIATVSSGVGIWDFEPQYNKLYWDKTMYDLYGVDKSVVPELETWTSRLHEEDRERAVSELQAGLAGGRPFNTSFRIVTPAGQVKYIRAAASRVSSDDGTGRIIGANWDVTETMMALEHLREAQRLGGLGSWSYDLETGRIEWSEQLYQLLGRDPHTDPPDFQSAMRDYDDASEALLRQAVHEAVSRGTPFTLELQTRHGLNGVRFVRAEGRVRRNFDGTILALYGTVLNVTAQRVHERSLKEAQLQSEAANLSKSEFLANMSHEIRTPMTAILGYADLLESDGELISDREQALDAIRTIKCNSAHLLSIINDILDMSKIDSGKMSVESIEIQVTSFVRDVSTLIQRQVDGKGLGLSVRFETPIPKVIYSDPTRLRQILLNLLGNAIKFTEAGSVSLIISHCPEQRCMRFCVADTGIGLTDRQRDSIARFEAFTQADSSTTRKFGGSGLGLRICNSFAKLLGGRIEIESTFGVGSRFTAVVGTGNSDSAKLLSVSDAYLQTKANCNDEVPSTQSQQGTRLDGLRILLAEDGPDNQRLISFILKKAGAEVTVVENGQIAVDTLDACDISALPHLVLMDMQMPELDGYEATRLLRKKGSNIPIIALTAHAMESDRQKCLDAGCNEYHSKPVVKETLIELCKELAETAAKQSPVNALTASC